VVNTNILPNFVDLNPIFEKLGLHTRPQGKRGTCSVFTVVGALEYAFAIRNGKGIFLSVEFLNWASHKVANRRADGGFFSELWDGFVNYGICAESDMPYMPEFDPDLQPSEEILKQAAKLKIPLKINWIKEWDVNTGLTEDQFVDIKRTLAKQFPVCGGFRWPKAEQWNDRVLKMCPPSDVFDGHSIILSGYRDIPSQPGGGIFAIHNSGGKSRDGYLSYEYVKTYMNDAGWFN
jgi:hypothetical protein